MKKSTLTSLSALVLLIVAVCVAFPKMSEPGKTSSIKTSQPEAKAIGQKVSDSPKPIDVKIGLTANFGPKPVN